MPRPAHTHPFNGPFSGTTRVSRYQKGKTNLDFTEARDSEWQWHQLGHMQVCTSLQTDNHARTPPLSFFTGRMPFLPPNQQRQSTEAICLLFKKACCFLLIYLLFNNSLKHTGPIFASFRVGRTMAVDDESHSEISFSIPRGMLLWQPNFVGFCEWVSLGAGG